jgi:hypothetical protein
MEVYVLVWYGKEASVKWGVDIEGGENVWRGAGLKVFPVHRNRGGAAVLFSRKLS